MTFAREIVRPMLFTFLLVVHALIAAALVGVILMQRSEGGGLGMGSGPSGLMTARGAADFLTRATTVLATLFVLMAFLLAALASMRNGSGEIDTSLAHRAAPAPITAPSAQAPTANIPMVGAGPVPAGPDASTAQALAPASAGLPQAQPAKQPTAADLHAQAEAQRKDAAARRAAAVASLKTIQTKPAKSTIGIGGVSAGNGSAAAPAVTPKATAPTFSIAPPANNAASVPTVNVPAPAAPGNSSQPR